MTKDFNFVHYPNQFKKKTTLMFVCFVFFVEAKSWIYLVVYYNLDNNLKNILLLYCQYEFFKLQNLSISGNG